MGAQGRGGTRVLTLDQAVARHLSEQASLCVCGGGGGGGGVGEGGGDVAGGWGWGLRG